jgi:hypothetical protein
MPPENDMRIEEEPPHGAPQESKKECEWCRELNRSDVLKCPHCGRWRKDIQEDINQQKQWMFCAIGFFVVAFSVMIGSVRIWGEDLSNEVPRRFQWMDRLELASLGG